MNHRSSASVVVAALMMLCCSAGEAPRPNLILISIDTLRADRMSLSGYARETTPEIDDLASDAVVFDAFFNAGGGTLQSHASLFTSLYPEVHGVERSRALRSVFQTLAEVLRSQGYQTAAFTDIVWLRRKYGFAQGFDSYDDTGGYLVRIIPKVRRWLSDTAREPFFLFLHAFDVHSKNGRLPYDSPDGFNELFTEDYHGSFDGCIGQRCASQLLLHINREVRAKRAEIGEFLTEEDLAYIGGLYDGGVRYVDREIGRFIDLLHETGLYDPTLLVVLADHGEELGEHGKVLHGNPYEEFVRIPLLMKLPGSRHAGRRIGGLASMLDVMPTLLDLLGLPATPGLQGTSLRPAIETGQTVRAFVASHGASIRSPRWKLVTSTRELFDLVSDPRERANLFDARPEVIARLSALRREVDRDNARRRERLGALPKARDPVSLSPDERERLRDLGYLE